MLNSPLSRILSLYLRLAVLALSLPAQSWAMLVPAKNSPDRAADTAMVQAALESTAVKQRLMDYGLSSEEASQRLAQLSDEQLHRFAAEIDAVQAGGDVGGDIVFVLVVVLIVLVILELTGHHVVMRH